jgi:hypothetical protein
LTRRALVHSLAEELSFSRRISVAAREEMALRSACFTTRAAVRP